MQKKSDPKDFLVAMVNLHQIIFLHSKVTYFEKYGTFSQKSDFVNVIKNF